MKPVEASAHISAIHVTEHTLAPQGYALYTLQIIGKTLFMPTPQVYTSSNVIQKSLNSIDASPPYMNPTLHLHKLLYHTLSTQ